VFLLLRNLIFTLQPILVPVCFAIAWIFAITLGWTIWSAVRDTAARTRQMHQIPCAQCQFFTNDYRLKCTVKPMVASTEEAIDCSDYRPV
jgi:hypothetical protein